MADLHLPGEVTGEPIEVRMVLVPTTENGRVQVDGVVEHDGQQSVFSGWIALLGTIESLVERSVGVAPGALVEQG